MADGDLRTRERRVLKLKPLEAKEVSKKYGDLLALDSFSLELRTQEACLLVGDNGSGKSTFLKIAAGLFAASSGSLKICERNAKEMGDGARKWIGYQPERFEIPPRITLREHVDLICEMKEVDVREGREILKNLYLEAWETPFEESSLGMRKKTALASALVGNPKLIILDEPSNGLDLRSQKALFKILKSRLEDNSALLFASHQLDWACQVATKGVVLKNGQSSPILERPSGSEASNWAEKFKGIYEGISEPLN